VSFVKIINYRITFSPLSNFSSTPINTLLINMKKPYLSVLRLWVSLSFSCWRSLTRAGATSTGQALMCSRELITRWKNTATEWTTCPRICLIISQFLTRQCPMTGVISNPAKHSINTQEWDLTYSLFSIALLWFLVVSIITCT
jgi:hypothetical protein